MSHDLNSNTGGCKCRIMYQDSNLHGQMSKKLGLPQNHVKRDNMSGQTQQQACHYHLAQAVITASSRERWSLAGTLPGNAAILPFPFFFFKKKKILFFPHHLTVFHRTPQCHVASLTEKSGDGRWGLRSGGSHRTGKQNPKPSAVSERAQERPYLSDKHSLRVITLFQLCNDINKLGIQGVT